MSDYVVDKDRRILIVDPATRPSIERLPSARYFQRGDKVLGAVPYTVEAARVLNVPSPIGIYYEFPHDRTFFDNPFPEQIETSAFMTLNPRGYVLNDIGTGKTLSALWALDFLMREGDVRKALIVSPLSTVNRVWGDEVFHHLRDRRIGVLTGSAARRRKILTDDMYDFYVVNHDGLEVICDVEWRTARSGRKYVSGIKLARDDIDAIVVDESDIYSNGTTRRWKVMNALKNTIPLKYFWGMTGTPTPNGPDDAFGQVKLFTPENLVLNNSPMGFEMFKRLTMNQMTEFIWIPRKDAHRTVAKFMKPAIRFERDDCVSLPECTYTTLEAPLSTEQQKHYKELEKELVTEVRGGKVTAINEGVKMNKLIQLTLGVVYDKDGVAREIDASPRLSLLGEVLSRAPAKAIVFVPFSEALRKVQDFVGAELKKRSKDFYAEMVNGGVGSSERGRIFAAFQRDPNCRVLVADAGCMSHGLTLTESNLIVWFGVEVSNRTYTQANGRITRPGQKRHQHVIHFSGTPVETKLYRRLQTRRSTQGALLDFVKEGILK